MAKQVMIIDDDENIRRFISLLMSENGYDPVTASDGAEGLQKVQQAKPDLIVLDVMLPRMSGLEVCKTLRGEGWEGPILSKWPECFATRFITSTGRTWRPRCAAGNCYLPCWFLHCWLS